MRPLAKRSSVPESMNLFRDPLGWITSLLDESVAFPQWATSSLSVYPSDDKFMKVDAVEKDGQLILTTDAPGVSKDNIGIELNGNELTISIQASEEKEDKTGTYHRKERTVRSTARTLTLPDGCDSESVKASLKDGILTVTLKKVPGAQPKKIEITE